MRSFKEIDEDLAGTWAALTLIREIQPAVGRTREAKAQRKARSELLAAAEARHAVILTEKVNALRFAADKARADKAGTVSRGGLPNPVETCIQ